MMNWIKKLITDRFLRSTVRGVLKVVGGVLIGLQIDPEIVKQFIEVANPVITGVAMALVAQLFSWLDKKRNVSS